jgi:hypothetical protein
LFFFKLKFKIIHIVIPIDVTNEKLLLFI